jgi:hypothetical protein
LIFAMFPSLTSNASAPSRHCFEKDNRVINAAKHRARVPKRCCVEVGGRENPPRARRDDNKNQSRTSPRLMFLETGIGRVLQEPVPARLLKSDFFRAILKSDQIETRFKAALSDLINKCVGHLLRWKIIRPCMHVERRTNRFGDVGQDCANAIKEKLEKFHSAVA